MFEDLVLDHVAIAVQDLKEARGIYEALGFVFSKHQEVVESQGVVTLFASIDNHARLELLQPLADKEGPISQYLKKRGQGIHHLCFKVKDIEQKEKELREKGYQFIYPRPVDGAGNTLVNFIHPKSASGVLIEIAQDKKV